MINIPDFVFDEFELGELFRILFEASKSLVAYVAILWNWLTQDILIGFDLPVLGEIGYWINPLEILFGIGLLFLITLWLIKSLVPVA